MIHERTVLLARLVPTIGLSSRDDTVYKRLKRFVQFAFPELLTARLVREYLQHEQQVPVMLD